MGALLELSTWAWIAGVFGIIKLVFMYLSWFYSDKDKSLKESVEQAETYLSQHSYYEVARAVLGRLHDRLVNIFEKKVRFLYLAGLFLLLNSVSLLVTLYFTDFDSVDVIATLTAAHRSIGIPWVNHLSETVDWRMCPIVAIQLTLLDLFSFLFTTGIIWAASRTKRAIMLLIELLTDLSMIGLFSGTVLIFLYTLHLDSLYAGLVGSSYMTSISTFYVLLAYWMFRCYESGKSFYSSLSENPFRFLFLAGALVCLPHITLGSFIKFDQSIAYVDAQNDDSFLLTCVFILPIIVFWSFRIVGWRSVDRSDRFDKPFLLAISGIILGGSLTYAATEFHVLGQLYSAYSSSATACRFVLILVISSALPTLAHLMAVLAAIMAKAMPARLQRYINRHLLAMKRSDDKVLSQLGNACGGLGALITAIIAML